MVMRGVSGAGGNLVTKTTWSCLTCLAKTASTGKIIIPALLGITSLGCFFDPARVARIAHIVRFDISPIPMSINLMNAFDKTAQSHRGSEEQMFSQTEYFSLTLAAVALASYVVLDRVAQTADYYTSLQNKFLFPRMSKTI